MPNSVLCGEPVTNPTVYGFADTAASFLGALSFREDTFAESLGETDGRVCARDMSTCSPSQAAAMNAVNKPARTALQTLIVQTCSLDQLSLGVKHDRAK